MKVYQTFAPLVHTHDTVGPSWVPPAVVPVTTSSAVVSVMGVALARSSLRGRQALVTQCVPAPHAVPHAPQFALLFVGSRHVPPQLSCPDGHGDITHAPPEQVRPAPQALPQVPQLEESTLVSVHVPPQSVSGELHTQVPPVHMRPDGHACPHVPQFAPSVVVLTQLPPHAVNPVPHAHAPLAHTRPPAHTMPHDPQLLASLCTSMHWVIVPVVHTIRGAGQLASQCPVTQFCPAAHAVPHAPQLA